MFWFFPLFNTGSGNGNELGLSTTGNLTVSGSESEFEQVLSPGSAEIPNSK